jgi:broad-specificity NMP kinase
MIKIAITGGIGSGKSYISHLLETMDVPVYNADNEAKRLMVSDEEIRRELIALLGKEVYDKEGALNKPLLASYLFSAPEHVRQINAIIHPRVREDFIRWIGELKECEIAGMESVKNKENGAVASIDYKKVSANELHAYFAEILPNYDRDRVHASDIKKLLSWYNILVSNGITDFVEQNAVATEEPAAEEGK